MIGRVLVVGLLGLPLAAIWRIGQDNGALSVFESRKNAWSLISVNDTGHLAAHGRARGRVPNRRTPVPGSLSSAARVRRVGSLA